MSALYLSNTGLMEPLGQSQIFPYLRELASDRPITLLSLDKPDDLRDGERRERFEKELRAAGIRWIPLRYHRIPAWDLATMFVVAAWICATSRVRILHARGFIVAALCVFLKPLFGAAFILDTRALSWVDQRVELGTLRDGSIVVRVLRWLERRSFESADVIIALSQGAADAMARLPAVASRPGRLRVITTCTDLELFRPAYGARPERPLTLGYVGNAGLGYLFDPVLTLFEALRAKVPEARLKIVNRADHALIRERLASRGLAGSSVELTASSYADVAGHMSSMDVGAFFYHWRTSDVPPVFTRMGEFLGCGVPCVSNVAGLGTSDILHSERVGVVVDGLDAAALDVAATRLLQLVKEEGLAQRCVASAHRHFSLAAGAERFKEIYGELEGRPQRGVVTATIE